MASRHGFHPPRGSVEQAIADEHTVVCAAGNASGTITSSSYGCGPASVGSAPGPSAVAWQTPASTFVFEESSKWQSHVSKHASLSDLSMQGARLNSATRLRALLLDHLPAGSTRTNALCALRMQNSGLNDEGVLELCTWLRDARPKRLSLLDVSRNDVGPVALQCLCECLLSPSAPPLSDLRMELPRDVAVLLCTVLERCRALTALHILGDAEDNTHLQELPMTDIVMLLNAASKLKTLRLSPYMNPEDLAQALLQGLPQCLELEHLSLAGKRLSAASVLRLITEGALPPMLRSLDISNNDVGASAIAALVGQRNRYLEQLNLRCTGLMESWQGHGDAGTTNHTTVGESAEALLRALAVDRKLREVNVAVAGGDMNVFVISLNKVLSTNNTHVESVIMLRDEVDVKSTQIAILEQLLQRNWCFNQARYWKPVTNLLGGSYKEVACALYVSAHDLRILESEESQCPKQDSRAGSPFLTAAVSVIVMSYLLSAPNDSLLRLVDWD